MGHRKHEPLKRYIDASRGKDAISATHRSRSQLYRAVLRGRAVIDSGYKRLAQLRVGALVIGSSGISVCVARLSAAKSGIDRAFANAHAGYGFCSAA
jgi:hypothetical protein